MSFIERSLPPGDRDDGAHVVLPEPSEPTYDAGRKPELPTIMVLKNWMESQQLALADLLLAEKQQDLALLEAAAMRLAEAFLPNMLKLVHQLRKEIAAERAAHRRSEKGA